jgi:hypothetical protein
VNDPIKIEAGPPIGPADAVAAALKNVNFDERVPKGIKVRVIVEAVFGEEGSVFYKVGVEAPKGAIRA